MAAAHSSCRPGSRPTAFMAVLIIANLLRLVVGAQVPEYPRARPTIRIACLSSEAPGRGFTPIKYLMQHFNVTDRLFLPDYDVVIDNYPIGSGEGPVELIRLLGGDTPDYHAILGPYWREDSLDVVDLVATARILNVHGGDNPSFSDRTLHPYSFRVQRSLEGTQIVMFYLLATFDWRKIISIWSQQDLWDASNHWADRWNITNYPTLSDAGAASWAVEAWQIDTVALVRSLRLRVIIVHVPILPGWQLICRVHRAKLSGLQYITENTWSPGWFMADNYPAILGNCTPQEMYEASGGHLVIRHSAVAAGANLSGFVFPAVGGNQGDIPLTCMPNLTASDFYNSVDHIILAFMDGAVTSAEEVEVYLAYAGVITDSLCSVLLALHNALYEKGVTLNDIERRDVDTFHALTQSLGEVDFRGPPGRFSFINGTGDPEYTYHILNQDAVRGRAPGSIDFAAVIIFPEGPYGTPVIDTLGNATPLVFRDGSTGLGSKPHLGLFQDCGLENGVQVWDYCEPCPAGTFYDALLRACRTCPVGQFQAQSGMGSCETAPPGWFVVDVQSPSSIQKCPIGHECPQAGTIMPQPCSMGRSASTTGQSECDLCPEGEYQNLTGSSGCEPCSAILAGAVTAAIASTSSDACICPAGTFRQLGSKHCSACLEGMVCPEGSDMRNVPTASSSSPMLVTGEQGRTSTFPLVQAGYMTIASEPLIVYRCLADGHCPGGPPGSCAAGRDPDTVACGDCLSGSYEASDECIKCGSNGSLPLVLTGIGGLVMVIVATLLINKDVHKTPAASIMIVAVSSLLLTSLQTMGVFSSMDLPWEEPVKTILELSQIMSFDLRLLKASCVVGVNPLRSFAMRQLTALMIVPFVWFTLALKKYAPRIGKVTTRIRVELCNSIGTLFSVFFISIVISAMDPFMCYEHPEGSESVTSAPSVLCFEGQEHTSMVVTSTIAMTLVPVPFWCACCYAVYMYPSKIIMYKSSGFLNATRFLFFRYVPHRYYFQIIVLLRSLLLCLIPAILRGQYAVQILFICVVLSGYVSLTFGLCPWRVHHCNLLDAMLSQLLVIFLVCGSLFLEDTPQKGTISMLSSIVIVSILLSAVGALSYAVWQRLAPSYYQFFICHHKAHAAAQSRYLKMMLQNRQRALTVFIDSDNLQELDSLFDIVKCRVKHLVVVLTANTLKRPWCVGEIVTATRAALLVTRLKTSSFVAPTEEQCKSPESYVDTTGCNLSEYGIQWVDVTDGLSAFLSSSTPELELSEDLPGTLRFDHVAAGLLRQRIGDRKVGRLSEIRPGSVLIVTHPESDEANASGGILLDRVAPYVLRACEHDVTLICDYEYSMAAALAVVRQASVAVVILSRGCLRSEMHVSIICELMAAGQNTHQSSSAPGVVSVNTPGFEFPSATAIGNVCQAFPALEQAHGNMASKHVASFFRRISILLPTHAAQQALDTQSQEVSSRIQASIKGKSSKHPSAARDRDSTSTKAIFINPAVAGSPTGTWSGNPSRSPSKSAPDTRIGAVEEDGADNAEHNNLPHFKWTVDFDEL